MSSNPIKSDPVFLMIAHSIMKQHKLPGHLALCKDSVRKYIAECLACSTTDIRINTSGGMSYGMGYNEIPRATLELVILHYNTDDINEEVESSLEIAGVEVEHTPGSIAATTNLHRFSGLDLNEQP